MKRMSETKKIRIFGSILIISLLIFSGCASLGPETKYIQPSSREALPDLGVSSGNKELNVSLVYIIIPNGQGAWVKGAKWDEYLLTFKNLSDKPLTVERIRLIDPRGLYIDNGTNLEKLEKESDVLAKEYKDMGMAYAPDIAVLGIGTLAATTGSLGLATAATVLAPVAAIGGVVWYYNKKMAEQKDREAIETEFERRQITTFTLSENATVSGSAFFPIIPNPKALVVDYRVGNETKTLEVSLEKLTGLHIAPAKKSEKKQE